MHTHTHTRWEFLRCWLAPHSRIDSRLHVCLWCRGKPGWVGWFRALTIHQGITYYIHIVYIVKDAHAECGKRQLEVRGRALIIELQVQQHCVAFLSFNQGKSGSNTHTHSDKGDAGLNEPTKTINRLRRERERRDPLGTSLRSRRACYIAYTTNLYQSVYFFFGGGRERNVWTCILFLYIPRISKSLPRCYIYSLQTLSPRANIRCELCIWCASSHNHWANLLYMYWSLCLLQLDPLSLRLFYPALYICES